MKLKSFLYYSSFLTQLLIAIDFFFTIKFRNVHAKLK